MLRDADSCSDGRFGMIAAQGLGPACNVMNETVQATLPGAHQGEGRRGERLPTPGFYFLVFRPRPDVPAELVSL
jgi:hypothetical protein